MTFGELILLISGFWGICTIIGIGLGMFCYWFKLIRDLG